jgi:hypothetical protein
MKFSSRITAIKLSRAINLVKARVKIKWFLVQHQCGWSSGEKFLVLLHELLLKMYLQNSNTWDKKKKQLRADMILYVCWWNVGKSMYWKYASNAPSSYFVFFFLQVSISYFANNGDYIWDYSYVAFHNTPNISSNGRKCWIVVEQCSFSLVQIPQICDIHSAFSAKIILSIILIWIFLRGCELW